MGSISANNLRQVYMYKERCMCAHAHFITFLIDKMFQGVKTTEQILSPLTEFTQVARSTGFIASALKGLTFGKPPHIHHIKDNTVTAVSVAG